MAAAVVVVDLVAAATVVATVAMGPALALVVAVDVVRRAMRPPVTPPAVLVVAPHLAGVVAPPSVAVVPIALTMPNPLVRMPTWARMVATVCRLAGVLALPANPTPCAPA